MTSPERLTNLDFSDDRDRSSILPTDAVVSSERANWDALYLQYYRYQAHEIPTNASQQHVLIVQTDIAEPGDREMTLDGVTQREALQEGQVLIVPAQTPNSAHWETPHGSINLGAIALSVMVLGSLGGMAVTYAVDRELTVDSHLIIGLIMTGAIAIAIAASLTPYMQKGNVLARNLHISINIALTTFFGWQTITGLGIVGQILFPPV